MRTIKTDITIIAIDIEVRTHVEVVTTVERTDKRKAHERRYNAKLKDPALYASLRLRATGAEVGIIYADQSGILYNCIAQDVLINTKRDLPQSYKLPEMLIAVSSSNIQRGTQLDLI